MNIGELSIKSYSLQFIRMQMETSLVSLATSISTCFLSRERAILPWLKALQSPSVTPATYAYVRGGEERAQMLETPAEVNEELFYLLPTEHKARARPAPQA